MAELKRLFFILFLLWLFAVVDFSLFFLVEYGGGLYWFAIFLQAVAISFYFVYVRYFRPLDTRTTELIITVLLLACTLIAISQPLDDNLLRLIPIASLIFWILYNSWFTKIPSIDKCEKVNLRTEFLSDGQTIALADFNSEFFVLCFTPGDSDPYFKAQYQHYLNNQEEFSRKKAMVVFITAEANSFTDEPNSENDLKTLVDETQKFSESAGVTGNMISQNNVFSSSIRTILPSVLIADKAGHVRYQKRWRDYRRRPDTDFLMRILESEEREKQATEQI